MGTSQSSPQKAAVGGLCVSDVKGSGDVGNLTTASPAQPSRGHSPQSKHSPSPVGRPRTPAENKVVSYTTQRFESSYEMTGKVLGEGSFAVVYECKRRESGELFACKVLSKSNVSDRDIAAMKNEVAILYHLSPHPSIVAIHGVFETDDELRIVMDLCNGGELYAFIGTAQFTISAAKHIMRSILRILLRCHQMGVVHRDVKLENFLLSRTGSGPGFDLKAADFGISCFYLGSPLTDAVGSSLYVAPETLQRSYGPESDIWSAGVILYMLMSGEPPFAGRTDATVFNLIESGAVTFAAPEWARVPVDCQALIKGLLTKDPAKRLTAIEALRAPWLAESGRDAGDRMSPVSDEVVERLRSYAKLNWLRKLASLIFVRLVRPEQTRGLRELFTLLDLDKTGRITVEELRSALEQRSRRVGAADVDAVSIDAAEALMTALDADRRRTLSADEFAAATLHGSLLQAEPSLRAVFAGLDRSGSGRVTAADLAAAMATLHMPPDEAAVAAVVRAADSDGDGALSYAEWRGAVLADVPAAMLVT